MKQPDLCTCSNQLQPHDRMSVCPPLPCQKADFPGDTCENWIEYGQDRCPNCAVNRGL